MKKVNVACLTLVLLVNASAEFGGGVGIGRDFTIRIDDTRGQGEKVATDSITISTGQVRVTVLPGELPVFVQRTDFRPKLTSFSAYLFAGLPWFVDRVQLTGTFSMWEYEGAIIYPLEVKDNVTIGMIADDPGNPDNYILQRQPATLSSQDISFFGIENTPYAKLHFDLSLTSTIGKPWKSFPLRLRAGGGLSLHFATPVLTDDFVSKVLRDRLGDNIDLDELAGQFSSEEITRYVVEQIIDRFRNPAFGMHLTANLTLRPDSWPIGFYVRAKYLMTLTELDPGIDVGGFGFLITTGIEIAI